MSLVHFGALDARHAIVKEGRRFGFGLATAVTHDPMRGADFAEALIDRAATLFVELRQIERGKGRSIAQFRRQAEIAEQMTRLMDALGITDSDQIIGARNPAPTTTAAAAEPEPERVPA